MAWERGKRGGGGGGGVGEGQPPLPEAAEQHPHPPLCLPVFVVHDFHSHHGNRGHLGGPWVLTHCKYSGASPPLR